MAVWIGVEIDIAIGHKEPSVYFAELRSQCQGGPKKYGNIVDMDDLLENLRMNAIPEQVMDMTLDDYPSFLDERRKLMANKIRQYFDTL